MLANDGVSIGLPSEGSFSLRGRLSPRQREVLDGILAGKPNRVIAQDLILSTRTVEAHRAAIMSKVGVSSVAELVQATTHLSDGGARLDMLCRIYPGLISFWDSSLILRFANHRHQMSFGQKVGDILGKSMNELFGEFSCRRNAPSIQGVLSGKDQFFTQVLRTPNGRLTTFSVAYSPQFDTLGNVEGFFAFMMDATALPDDTRAPGPDQGDESPRAAAGEPEVASPWAEMVLDDNNRIVSINDAFTDITHFRQDEVRGRTPIMIKPAGVEPAAFMRFWAEILAEREWQGMVWYRRRDGYLFRSRQQVTVCTGRRRQVGARVLFTEIMISQRERPGPRRTD